MTPGEREAIWLAIPSAVELRPFIERAIECLVNFDAQFNAYVMRADMSEETLNWLARYRLAAEEMRLDLDVFDEKVSDIPKKLAAMLGPDAPDLSPEVWL